MGIYMPDDYCGGSPEIDRLIREWCELRDGPMKELFRFGGRRLSAHDWLMSLMAVENEMNALAALINFKIARYRAANSNKEEGESE